MVLNYQNVSSTVLIFSCIDRILQIYPGDSTTVFSVNTGYYSKIPHIRYCTEQTWTYFSLIKPVVYIIDLTDRNLEDILQFLEYHTFFNPSALFILIADFIDSAVEVIVGKYYIYTYMILDISAGALLTLYGRDMMAKNQSEPVKIGYCMSTSQSVLFTESILDRKVEPQWDNLIIKIGVGDSPPSIIQDLLGDPFQGMDIDIVEFISARMKLNIQYKQSENFIGTKTKNIYNGALGTLATKSADMIMGGMFATADSCLDFTISYPIYRTSYSWFVPGPKAIPFWQRILLIYQPSVSISIFLFYVLMILLNVFFNRLILDEEKKFHNEFFKLWSATTGAPIKICKEEKCSKKMFYICWFLFWLILNACFASKLLECLIKKKYNYPINSLEALTQSELDICILRGLEFGLEEYRERVITCTNCEECLNRTAFQKDLITVRNSDLVNFYMNRYYLGPGGDPLLHPLKKNYFSTFHVMIFRKNHPAFEKFNKILKRMVTFGIVAYLRRKYIASWEENNSPIVNEWRSLRLEPLKFIFQFWIYGLIIAIIVFVIEILMRRYIVVECR